MNEEKVRYCIYAKWRGFFGWFYPWVLIGISDTDEGYDVGYGGDAYHAGYKIMRVKMEIPLIPDFYRVPKRAKVLGPVIQKVME